MQQFMKAEFPEEGSDAELHPAPRPGTTELWVVLGKRRQPDRGISASAVPPPKTERGRERERDGG